MLKNIGGNRDPKKDRLKGGSDQRKIEAGRRRRRQQGEDSCHGKKVSAKSGSQKNRKGP